MSVISEFKNFVGNIEATVTGDVGRLNISDDVAKGVATIKVAEYLIKEFETSVTTTWAQLDAQPTDATLSSVIGLLHTGAYEQAALGLVYILYQKAIEETNKVAAVVKTAVTNAEAAVAPSTTATTATAAITPASTTPAAAPVATPGASAAS